MISALDMLRSRLGDSLRPLSPGDKDALNRMLQAAPPQMSEADRRLQAMGSNLPEYLPQAVWDSILNKPTYGEGRVIPGPPNPLMEQEEAAGVFAGPQRDDQLPSDLAEAERVPNPYVTEDQEPRSWALPEGDVWSSRRPEQSPYASPLNQLMRLGRRAPLALY